MSRPELLSVEKRVCIICEGLEEYDYLEKIKTLALWNKKYLVDLRNARGIGRISAIYQDRFHNGSYDAILIFCDTDKYPFKAYKEMKNKNKHLKQAKSYVNKNKFHFFYIHYN